MFNSQFRHSRHLSHDEQRLINMYVNQYNQTNIHIEMLLDMLDEIRGNIFNIININQPRRTRINRHSRNSNTNRMINQIFNDMSHDYENPIDTMINNNFGIHDFFMNSPLRRQTLFSNNTNNHTNNINTRTTRTNEDLTTFLNNFLNTTVIVRPTTEQIQNASRIVRYGDIDNPISDTCPISLDNFNNDDNVRQLLPCGHIFHENQFQEWFQSNVRCPVCRYDIRNYRPLSRRNTPTSPRTNNPETNPSNVSSINNVSTSNQTNTEAEPNINENNIFSNFNVVRDPESDQIEQVTFDITDSQFTNNFIDRIARTMFQSILNPDNNTNDRFMIDPSNNVLFYETIIRQNNSNQNRNN